MRTKVLKKYRGFTLIELLTVISILAVLVIALLLALNPAEAQKRSRDAKRLRDVATLQAILNQYLESGEPMSVCLTSALPNFCKSSSISGNASNPCSSNWLGINVCAYSQTIPVDPNNGQMRTFVGSGIPNTEQKIAEYRARVVGSDYEINVSLEAESNRRLITSDTGTDPQWHEVFSQSAEIIPAIWQVQ